MDPVDATGATRRPKPAAPVMSPPGWVMDANAQILLSLYREARSRPTVEFQAFAIRLIRPSLRFESAVWTGGHLSDDHAHPLLVPLPALTYTHETNPDGVAEWKAINRADKTIPIVFAHPFMTQRIHTPTLFAPADERAMRDYARRFGRQNALITALSQKGAPIVQWCSLYRPRADDLFTRNERAHCRMFMHHLSEALTINRLIHQPALGASLADDATLDHSALVSRDGTVLSAGGRFREAVVAQWSAFDGRHIPAPLLRQITADASATCRARHVTVRASRIGDLFLLTAADAASERLPPRRMDIAVLFAQGQSAKAIAKRMGISPSTVRNQLAISYRALGVSSRTALQAALEARVDSAARTMDRRKAGG